MTISFEFLNYNKTLLYNKRADMVYIVFFLIQHEFDSCLLSGSELFFAGNETQASKYRTGDV